MQKIILHNKTFLVILAEYVHFFPFLMEIISLLGDDEIKNFQKEKNLHIKNCKCIRLWILKKILSQIYGIKEKELLIKKSPEGKPFLKNLNLSFNQSTSHNFFAGIYHLNEPCGIDIEEIVPIPENQIPYFVFSKNEIQTFSKIPNNIDFRNLYSFWTCKEALLKYTGEGIDQDLDKLDFATCNQKGEIETEFVKKSCKILRLNYATNIALAVSFKNNIEYQIESYSVLPYKSHSLELAFQKLSLN